jgi:hypothetical protein
MAMYIQYHISLIFHVKYIRNYKSTIYVHTKHNIRFRKYIREGGRAQGPSKGAPNTHAPALLITKSLFNWSIQLHVVLNSRKTKET